MRSKTFALVLSLITLQTPCAHSGECNLAGFGFPAKDRPNNADLATLDPGTSSEDYYFGLKGPVDFKKARFAAFKEAAQDACYKGEVSYRGVAMLALLYARGSGVPRDSRYLETYLAGNYKLEVFQEKKSELASKAQWDFLDIVYSTPDINAAASARAEHESKLADNWLTALRASVPPSQASLFDALLSAQIGLTANASPGSSTVYGTARASEEIDMDAALDLKTYEYLLALETGNRFPTAPQFDGFTLDWPDGIDSLRLQEKQTRELEPDVAGSADKCISAWKAYLTAFIHLAHERYPRRVAELAASLRKDAAGWMLNFGINMKSRAEERRDFNAAREQ